MIKAENISKQYKIRHEQPVYRSLREDVTEKTAALFSRRKKVSTETFWALKNISFEIQQGDRIGVIGRNGAGKSTLLKVLSRIIEPTEGKITIEGRIASLLEVGTGFHPELSGRENIYLNGAILGMSRKEIRSRFDEIVAFAEVDRFLDTPVKRYSSGMYVRLAFAVAAHLEPEILIVDEVLAVGDAQFQQKCIGKMQDVSRNDGRTVVFVSHNMAAIQNLCDKLIYLEKGSIKTSGNTAQVIKTYLSDSSQMQQVNLSDRQDRTGNGAIVFESFQLKDKEGHDVRSIQCGSQGILQFRFRKKKDTVNNLQIAIGINDNMGQRITHFSNETTDQFFNNVHDGTIQLVIDKVPFRQGRYSFTLFSSVNGEIADYLIDAGTFDVEEGDFFNTGKLPPDGQGSIFVNHSFRLQG